MKKIVCLLLTAAIIGAMGCIDGNRVEETGHEDYSAALFNRVEIETGNGEIKATVTTDTLIGVTLTRWATGVTDRSARDHMDEIKVDVTRDTADSILRIFIHLPVAVGYSTGCDAELSLPESLFVDLQTSKGKITAEGNKAGLRLSSSNGEIEMTNTGGDAEVETSNGAITVDMHRGNITGHTSNGAVTADVVMPDSNGTCSFKSSNGKIVVAVPDSVNAQVWLKTSNGDIHVEDLGIGDMNSDDDIFEGKLGDGSGSIELETSNGNVTLKKLTL